MLMKRFHAKNDSFSIKNQLLSIVLFLGIVAMFLGGISTLSKLSSRQESETLRLALVRGAVSCYALNGYYPESLEDLTYEYGITYDREQFLVDYQPQGANIMPEIIVIQKGGDDS